MNFLQKPRDELIHENMSFSDKSGLNPYEKDKFLPIMYWTEAVSFKKLLKAHQIQGF